jgi:hypothetical protein
MNQSSASPVSAIRPRIFEEKLYNRLWREVFQFTFFVMNSSFRHHLDQVRWDNSAGLTKGNRVGIVYRLVQSRFLVLSMRRHDCG